MKDVAYILFFLNLILFLSALFCPQTIRTRAPGSNFFILIISFFFSVFFLFQAITKHRRKPKTPPPEKQIFVGWWFTPGKEFYHIGVVGPTGSGKTLTFYIPSILAKAKENCSLIITDPKGELYKYTAHYLKEQGKNIYVFKPLDIQHTNFYNPIDYLKKDGEFGDMADSILMNVPGLEKSEWKGLSQPLLTSALQYLSLIHI